MAVKGLQHSRHVHSVPQGAVADVRKPASKGKTSKVVDQVVLGPQPKAPVVAQSNVGGVAGRSLDALKNKLLGKSTDPVATLLAKLEGQPDSVAAAILADAFSESIKGAV